MTKKLTKGMYESTSSCFIYSSDNILEYTVANYCTSNIMVILSNIITAVYGHACDLMTFSAEYNYVCVSDRLFCFM